MLFKIIIVLFTFSAQNYLVFGNVINDIEGIVNGEPAKVNQAPWQVLVYVDTPEELRLAGGSFIAKNAVLTAAHVCNYSASQITVQYGGLDRTNLTSKRNVSRLYTHPNFMQGDIDLCVMILDHDKDNDNVKIIDIADKVPPIGTELVVTGWGNYLDLSHVNESYPIKLRTTKLYIVNHEKCKKVYKDIFPIPVTKTVICAQTHSNATTCHGDSGGALVYGGKLVGVVSWGANCTISPEYPNVFANAVMYKKWIEDKISSSHF